jgi:SpoVK/Ycf46/Vps4 family AAA+-type ATPase
MIDEIDAIGMKRGKEDVGEMARIVIVLMQAMDCVKNDCVIIGATNRQDMIDKALLRPFSILHEVKMFTREERKAMVEKYLGDIGIKYDISDVNAYCEAQKSQADTIVDVVKAIAKSIRFDCPLRLTAAVAPPVSQ